MSVLLKNPRIEEICDGLDSDTLAQFKEFLNTNEGYSTHYSIRKGSLPVGVAPFVAQCTLSIDGPAELCGVFVRYNAEGGKTGTAMVSFTDLDDCLIYDIDEAKMNTRKVRERLNASELRRVISERLGGGGDTSDVITKGEDGSVTLNQGLTVSKDGSVEIGKNLEVDGSSSFLGKEVKILNFFGGEKGSERFYGYFIGYCEESSAKPGVFYVNGLFGNTEGDAMYAVFDSFKIDNAVRTITTDAIILTKEGVDSLPDYAIPTGRLKTIFGNQSLVGSGNIDLYRHRIICSVGNKTGATLHFEYISSSNLKCDSIQDLRTLLRATQFDLRIYGDFFTDYAYVESGAYPNSRGTLIISTNECKIVGPATARETLNVTTVSDTVTTI